MKPCKICSYSMPACVEGDYCPDCLTINLILVGDYRVDPENEYIIRKDWKKYFHKLNCFLKDGYRKVLRTLIEQE